MVNSKLRRHKVMEKAIKALMSNNLPPRFKFKDTYDSIEVPSGYTLPSQQDIEDKFDELLAEEESMPTIDAAIEDIQVISSNLYVNTNTGRVGIGTTTPGYTLDVNGTANVGALTATTISGPLTGNATTATTLQTARTIGGVSFDGSGNISLPGVNTTGNQNTSGNAATATTATNQSGGTVNATTGAFSGNVTLSGGKLIASSSVSTDSTSGIMWHGSNSGYSITRTSGAWSSPNYQQLLIKWNTGMILDVADGQYGRSYVGVNDRMAIGSSYYNSNTKPPDNGLLVQGNVGIGIESPVYTLDVNGVSRSRGVCVNSGFSNNTARPALSTGSTHPSYEIRSIGGNGNVGSAGGDDGFLRLRAGGGTGTNSASYIDLSGYSVYSGNDMKRNIVFGTFGTERMRILENGNVGIGVTSPSYKLHVVGDAYVNGRTLDVHSNQTRFNGYHYDATYRAQIILSSAYSDMIIASSQANNNHGSTLSFCAYNPTNSGDYRKWVINQGNWGSRKQFLDFGYADVAYPNPHSYINSTNTLLTLDGINKYVGIRNTSPTATLDVAGSFRVRGGNTSTFGNDGLLHINSRSTTHGSETVALQTTIDSRALTAANPGTHGGESRNVLALQPDGGYVGIGTTNPVVKLDVRGDIMFSGSLYQLNRGLGGEIVFDRGGYRIHIFKASGIFTSYGVTTADVLLVAGGGGGGADNSGGGGAGGLIFRPGMTITNGVKAVVIGQGGIGAPTQDVLGTNGSNSTFNGLTALGGGRAANGIAHATLGVAGTGGSGGGGQGEWSGGYNGASGLQPSQSGDSGTYGYGNRGGNGTSGGGGGGGAGAAGNNRVGATGGDGGEGKYFVTSGGTTYDFLTMYGYCGVGDNNPKAIENQTWTNRLYFAGGGGGGNENDDAGRASGGVGGGGGALGIYIDSSTVDGGPSDPKNGLPNTGGGGAGGTYSGSLQWYTGGNGGSGVCIIRYAI